MTPAQKAASAPAAGRYASLTVVRDGDGYVLGSQCSPDFVAVPDIGGQVVRWLQYGTSLDECGRRAAELAGQPVDVAGFIDRLLTTTGLLTTGLRPATPRPASWCRPALPHGSMPLAVSSSGQRALPCNSCSGPSRSLP